MNIDYTIGPSKNFDFNTVAVRRMLPVRNKPRDFNHPYALHIWVGDDGVCPPLVAKQLMYMTQFIRIDMFGPCSTKVTWNTQRATNLNLNYLRDE